MAHKKMKTVLLCMASALLLALSSHPARSADPQHTLTVGVAGSAPFVIDTQQQTGISLEIWQNMANVAGVDYRLEPFTSVPQALAALDSGRLDMVIGPVSITADRVDKFRFTQPYFMTSLSIMSRVESPTIWQRIKPFFSIHFFYAVFIFLCILAIVGTLLWLTERHKNPDEFPLRPARGIANGMWCAIVTMSTTGYGDRSPKTFWGRLIAGSWMIISIIFATTMVAGIASTLTLTGFTTNTISKAEDLSKKKVAVVKNSPAEDLVKKYNGKAVYIESLQQGYEALEAKKVSAVLYDRAQLLYLNKEKNEDDISVSVYEYFRQGYGFAVPRDYTGLDALNKALLTLQESGRIAQILNEWIGVNNKP